VEAQYRILIAQFSEALDVYGKEKVYGSIP
jgi:hypothetical protein